MRYAWTVMSPWGLQVSKWEALPEQVHSPKSILESEPSPPHTPPPPPRLASESGCRVSHHK